MGAGPALMALAVAATTMAPRYRLFPMINIPLWVLTAVFVLIRIGTVGSGNFGTCSCFACRWFYRIRICLAVTKGE